MVRLALAVVVVAAVAVAVSQLGGCSDSPEERALGRGGGVVDATISVMKFPAPLSPIPGATVTISFVTPIPNRESRMEPRGTYVQLTDRRGVASFPRMAEGVYRVRVIADGYEPHVLSQPLIEQGAGFSAEGVSDYVFVMQPARPFGVTASVNDASGNPAGTFDYWIRETTMGYQWSGQGTAGQASMTGLRNGNYDVTVTCGPWRLRAGQAPLALPKQTDQVLADLKLPPNEVKEVALSGVPVVYTVRLNSFTYRPSGNERRECWVFFTLGHSSAAGPASQEAEPIRLQGDQPFTREWGWKFLPDIVVQSGEAPGGQVVEVPIFYLNARVTSDDGDVAASNYQEHARESTLRTPELPTQLGETKPYTITSGPLTFRLEIKRVN